MPLYLFYTMVQKKSKMTKNSNQGGPALKGCALYVFIANVAKRCDALRQTRLLLENAFLGHQSALSTEIHHSAWRVLSWMKGRVFPSSLTTVEEKITSLDQTFSLGGGGGSGGGPNQKTYHIQTFVIDSPSSSIMLKKTWTAWTSFQHILLCVVHILRKQERFWFSGVFIIWRYKRNASCIWTQLYAWGVTNACRHACTHMSTHNMCNLCHLLLFSNKCVKSKFGCIFLRKIKKKKKKKKGQKVQN